MNLGAAILLAELALVAGVALGAVVQAELHEQDHRRVLRLCDQGGLGRYFVGHAADTWHCFYEQPSWPYRVKRSVMVFSSGIEGPAPLNPRERH